MNDTLTANINHTQSGAIRPIMRPPFSGFPTSLAMFGSMGNPPPIFPWSSPSQYAATIASITNQMNCGENTTMSKNCSVPFLLPSMYRSILNGPFPGHEQLMKSLQLSPSLNMSPLVDTTSQMCDQNIPIRTNPMTKSTSPRKRASHKADSLTGSPPKRPRSARKLKLDDDETISPVSGIFIRDISSMEDMDTTPTKIPSGPTTVKLKKHGGDIECPQNLVEVTDAARAALAKVVNVIGAYVCQLCRTEYEDAFCLAAHTCPRIGHVEYRCNECAKMFSCPANLASHQRWHKPWQTNKGSPVIESKIVAPELKTTGMNCEDIALFYEELAKLHEEKDTADETIARLGLAEQPLNLSVRCD